jgi:hypothetical protein
MQGVIFSSRAEQNPRSEFSTYDAGKLSVSKYFSNNPNHQANVQDAIRDLERYRHVSYSITLLRFNFPELCRLMQWIENHQPLLTELRIDNSDLDIDYDYYPTREDIELTASMIAKVVDNKLVKRLYLQCGSELTDIEIRKLFIRSLLCLCTKSISDDL